MKKRRRKQYLKRRKLRGLARAEQNHIDETEQRMVRGNWSNSDRDAMIDFVGSSLRCTLRTARLVGDGLYSLVLAATVPMEYITMTLQVEPLVEPITRGDFDKAVEIINEQAKHPTPDPVCHQAEKE